MGDISYRCGKCDTGFEEEAPLVMTVNAWKDRPGSVTVTCQWRGCGHSVTAPTLAEAFAAIGKKEEPCPPPS